MSEQTHNSAVTIAEPPPLDPLTQVEFHRDGVNGGVMTLGQAMDGWFASRLQLLDVSGEELELIRAVLKGEPLARETLADWCEDRRQYARADRVRGGCK